MADNVFSVSKIVATFCFEAFSDIVGSELQSIYLQDSTCNVNLELSVSFDGRLFSCTVCLDCVGCQWNMIRKAL